MSIGQSLWDQVNTILTHVFKFIPHYFNGKVSCSNPVLFSFEKEGSALAKFSMLTASA